MIELSNGHRLIYVVASGALAFDGRGWLWERPLTKLGFIKREWFTTVIKTLTLAPRPGNLRWSHPWSCVAGIPGGSVNKIGLTNPGFEHWFAKIAPTIEFAKYPIIGSIYGDESELVQMARLMNMWDLVGLEINYSCPNTGHPLEMAERVVESVAAVKRVSRLPLIVKVSVDQDYLAIAAGLDGIAEAIALNSVPFSLAFPGKKSPLWRLEKKVGGGGGGVSGRPAQNLNWAAVRALSEQGALPVIGPSVMEYDDLARVKSCGAQAISFGAIHLPDYPLWRRPWTIFTNPCKPTQIVRQAMQEKFEIR
jgi:dihydroorotate dehydrogenase (fumarate)